HPRLPAFRGRRLHAPAGLHPTSPARQSRGTAAAPATAPLDPADAPGLPPTILQTQCGLSPGDETGAASASDCCARHWRCKHASVAPGGYRAGCAADRIGHTVPPLHHQPSAQLRPLRPPAAACARPPGPVRAVLPTGRPSAGYRVDQSPPAGLVEISPAVREYRNLTIRTLDTRRLRSPAGGETECLPAGR